MIWLIGNKGMLGTDVEARLQEQGLDYIATDAEVDITDLEALEDFVEDRGEDNEKISYIINCAAYSAVDEAEDERELAFKINSRGPFNIVKVCKKLGATLIHISTDYVFNGDKRGPYNEDDVPDPLSIYGKSKYEGDKNIIENLKAHYIIRVSWMFGQHGNNFVKTMQKLFNKNDEVKVVSDQVGSPTYSRDVAGFIVDIINNDDKRYGIYHFTNEGKTNWYEFAKEIYSLSKRYKIVKNEVLIKPVATQEYPAKAKRPLNSYLSKEKAKRDLGIEIRAWQDALEDFLQNQGSHAKGKKR